MSEESATSVKANSRDVESDFRRFVEENRRMVFMLALDLSGDHADADDIAQDVFLKAFLSYDKFRGEAKAGTWLYRITVNAFIDRSRRKAHMALKHGERIETEFDHARYLNSRRPEGDPEDLTAAAEMKVQIESALDTLSPQQRVVFVLRHYKHLALKEIAEHLSISEGTVKSLLFRAIQRLREALAHYRNELGLEESA